MSYMLRGQVYQVLESENACDDFYVACDYGLNQACAIVEEECYPKTGSMPYENKFGAGLYGGENEYTFDNTLNNEDLLISIRRSDNKYRIRSVFIRSGESFTVKNIPNGRYLIEEMNGNKWTFGILRKDLITRGGFLENEDFERTNLILNLYNGRGNSKIRWAVPGGTLTSEEISENEFLN